MVSCVFDESMAPAFEDSTDELGVFFVDVFEELDREAALSSDEERLGEGGCVVFVGRPSGLSPSETNSTPSAPRSPFTSVMLRVLAYAAKAGA